MFSLHVFVVFYVIYHVCVCRLEGTEDKLRNRESRPEDLHLIAELRELVSEREALVKKLVVCTLQLLGEGLQLNS